MTDESDDRTLGDFGSGGQTTLGGAAESIDEDPDETDVDELAAALETIRAEFGDAYDEWLRFAGDLTDYAVEETGHDVEFYPPRIHMPVVRYQQMDAEAVRRTDEITPEHVSVMIQWAAEQ